MLAGECQRGDDVVDGDAACHEPGPVLDHRVEEGAGVLVGGIAGFEELAAETVAKLVGGESGGGRGVGVHR